MYNNQPIKTVMGEWLILELSCLGNYLISLKVRKIIIVKVTNVLQVKCK